MTDTDASPATDAASPDAAFPDSPLAAVTRSWSCVLFDLDGTIIDSAPAITRALVETFTDMGFRIPGPTELLAYVGPPILESFRDLAGMSDRQAREALGIYRTHYDVSGAIDAAVFPGVAGLISALQDAGLPVALATSKPEYLARRVLDHFGLADRFTEICGATVDESISEKTDIVALALRRLAEKGVDVGRAVMVGDRIHDVVGAADNRVPTIIVEWGYGSPEEAEDAIAIVHSVDRLRELLLG